MRKHYSRKQVALVLVAALLTMIPLTVHASPPTFLSHAVLLEVPDQRAVAGTVTVDSVYSHGPGYVVIYGDYQGVPARPVGHVWVDAGWSYNVQVRIDMSRQLSTAYAILHGDSGQVGVYELGMAWGADAPALVDGRPITVAFRLYYPVIRM